MSSERKIFLRNQITEELALFPSRVAQYFFLLSTLEQDLNELETKADGVKKKFLKNENIDNENIGYESFKHTHASTNDKTLNAGSLKPNDCYKKKKKERASSPNAAHNSSFTVIKELFEAQKKILNDKLFVDECAVTWTRDTKRALQPFFDTKPDELYCSTVNFFKENEEARVLRKSSACNNFETSTNNQPSPYYSNNCRSFLSPQLTSLSRDNIYSSSLLNSNASLSRVPFSASSHSSFSLSQKISGPEVSSAMRTTRRGTIDKISSCNTRKSGSVLSADLSGTPRSVASYTSLHVRGNVTPKCASVENLSTIKETSPEGLIIKLGSQKRRKQTNMKTVVHRNKEKVNPVISETLIRPEEIDDSLCPVCQKTTGGKMVQCDECDKWCHCSCVGFIMDAKASKKSFFCPKCSKCNS